MKATRRYLTAVFTAMLAAGCSTTSNLPEGETLYTGIKEIKYTDACKTENWADVSTEVEAALACPPNGAILGSSSLRSPLLLGLRVYNKYSGSESRFGQWMLNHFGSNPVLTSSVNPEVRSLVAENVMKNNGFFNAEVTYKTFPKGKRKARLGYYVTANSLSRIDTLLYLGYPATVDSLIKASWTERLVRRGDPFAVSKLESERTRISNLMRENGYYYFRPAYSAFTADTVSVPGRVEVHIQPVEGLSPMATRQWYLGRLSIDMRRNMTDRLTDSLVFRILTVRYSGKKPPVRLRALLRDMKLRPGQLFRQSTYSETAAIINRMGLFSMSDFSFTPRDTTATCDTLDMTLNCVFDKPYDVSIEANYKLKSNDRTGPGLVLGLTKRNAFRGGEKLSVNLKGSYEWQTGKQVGGSSSTINSYEYGADISIEYPRLETPFGLFKRHRFHAPPTTLFSLSGDVLNRADYFKMLTVTGAVTYKFQTSANSRHELSPFLLDYNIMHRTTATFDSIMNANPAIYVSMRNQFVPKIKYSYNYTSPSHYNNPIAWDISLTESGNLLSLLYMAAGKKFNEKEKDLFGNPFAQFLKVNTSLRKTWQLSRKSQLVGRVAAGLLYAYGNSERAPYSEQFYVGGANSIRAFTIRSIGPGKYVASSSRYSYLDQTGDIKFEANLEYRFNLFGSLYGAVFLDAGNIWLLKKDGSRPDSEFNPATFLTQLATGTGAGLRYDLDFLVLRLDLGVAIHVPYETEKGGYYNIPRFKDGLGLHFAIGYPF